MTDELIKGFEAVGVETVRRDIGLGFQFEPDAEQRAAIVWVATQDKIKAEKEAMAQKKIIGWTQIGAIAAILAAIASVVAVVLAITLPNSH